MWLTATMQSKSSVQVGKHSYCYRCDSDDVGVAVDIVVGVDGVFGVVHRISCLML